jgi:hypothetical protein
LLFGDHGLAPFQVGQLVFTRRLEDAIAGVPVGLQGDLVEKSVGQSPQGGQRLSGEVKALQRQAAPARALGGTPERAAGRCRRRRATRAAAIRASGASGAGSNPARSVARSSARG